MKSLLLHVREFLFCFFGSPNTIDLGREEKLLGLRFFGIELSAAGLSDRFPHAQERFIKYHRIHSNIRKWGSRNSRVYYIDFNGTTFGIVHGHYVHRTSWVHNDVGH